MNSSMTSAQLKYIAKGQLFGKSGTVIGAFLVHILLYIPFIYFIDYIGVNSLLGIVLYFGATIVINLYAGVLSAGEKFMYLKLASGGEIAVSDLFTGFRNNPLKIVYLRAIPVIITVIIKVPGFILLQKFAAVSPDVNTMLTLMQPEHFEEFANLSLELFPLTSMIMLFKVLEFIVTIVVDIMFSQVIFFMWDYPEYGVYETLVYGIRIMKGKWGRYLYIKLSFIPWLILGFVSMYIGFLWAYPYYCATMANLYMDIIKNHDQEKR